MLVLSREEDQQIDINGGFGAGGITITVVQVRPGKVRLGIDAPKEIPIHRREVREAIERQQRGMLDSDKS